MKTVKLTLKQTGRKIFINISQIVMLDQQEECTKVYVRNTDVISVKEKAEDIADFISTDIIDIHQRVKNRESIQNNLKNIREAKEKATKTTERIQRIKRKAFKRP